MRHLQRVIRRSGRRIGAGVLTMCYLCTLIGLPAQPLRQAAFDGPYPCQDGTCGCGSASQCWRSCCCFTDQQKLDWAADHHVTPPADFLRRTAAQGLRPSSTMTQPSHTTSGAACCQLADKRPPTAAGCCRAEQAALAPPEASGCGDAHRDVAAAGQPRWVIAIETFKCRGLGSDWTGVAPCVMPPAHPVGALERLVTPTAIPAAAMLPEIFLTPPAPPPRAPRPRPHLV